MNLVSDNAIPVVPVLCQIELAHGLNRGEGDTLAEIDFALGDSTHERFAHVPLGSLLALPDKVERVAQPEGAPPQPCGKSYTHLRFPASGGTLQDTVLGGYHRLHRRFLVVIERNIGVKINLCRGSETARKHSLVGYVFGNRPKRSKGQHQFIPSGLIQREGLRGVPEPQVHTSLFRILGVRYGQISLYPHQQFRGRVCNSQHIGDCHLHWLIHLSSGTPQSK